MSGDVPAPATAAAPTPPSGPTAGLRILVAAGALACLALAVLLGGREQRLDRGAAAPALRDAAAGIDLASMRGRPVLVDFFASWCPPCVAVAPAVAEAHAGGLAVLGVALERPETVASLPGFRDRHGIAWPVAVLGEGFDHPLVADWRIRSIPTLILVAPDGTLASGNLAGRDAADTAARIRAAVAALPAR